MNSNKKYDFYKNAIYFLIANAVLLVAAIVIFAVFGLKLENNIANGQLILPIALVSMLSLIFVLIYVGLRHDFAKAWTAVVASAHNLILSVVILILIRIPVNESLIAGFALVVGLTTLFTLMLTNNVQDENLKKADYSEIIKNASSKNFKQIALLSAITIAVLFLSLIIASKDIFAFARIQFVMIMVVLYSTLTIILPIWCFFSSKIKKIKRIKADENVENQKVVLAVQPENQTNENE